MMLEFYKKEVKEYLDTLRVKDQREYIWVQIIRKEFEYGRQFKLYLKDFSLLEMKKVRRDPDSYVPIGYVPFETLTRASEDGKSVVWYHSLPLDGLGEDFVLDGEQVFCAVEIDNLPILEQRNKWDEFIKETGLEPITMAHSGGKSIHVLFKVLGIPSKEEWQRIQKMLTVLMRSDVAMTKVSQPLRLTGLPRIYGAEKTQAKLEYKNPEAVHSYQLFLTTLQKKWEKTFKYSYSNRRFEKYKEFRNPRSKNYDPENPEKAFNLPEEDLFPKALRDDTEVLREYFGKRSSDESNYLIDYLLPLVANRHYTEIFNEFDHDFRGSGGEVRGRSPWSEQNRSGTAFSLDTKNLRWYCHASGFGGGVYAYYSYILTGNPKPGNQWKEVQEYIQNKHGAKTYLEWQAEQKDIKAGFSKEILKIVSIEPTVDIQSAESYISVVTPEISYTSDFPKSSLGKNKIVLFQGTEIDAQKIANHLSNTVFCYSRLNLAELSEKLSEFDRVQTLVLIPKPGAVVPETSRKALQKLKESLSEYPVKFAWYSQLAFEDPQIWEVENLKAIKLVDFEDIARKGHYTLQKIQNKKILAGISKLTFEPINWFDSEKVSEGIPDITPGRVQLVDAPMGSGKTYYKRLQVDKWLKKNPHSKHIELGSRNSLLTQTAKMFSSRLVIQLKEAGATQDQINAQRHIICCTDSILNINEDSFKGALVVLDEVESILSHTLSGHTCERNRGEILAHLYTGIKTALSTGGAVLALEANITDLTVEYFKDTIGTSEIDFYKSRHKGTQKNIKIYDGDKSGLVSKILADLQRGVKIVLPTDSKEFQLQIWDQVQKNLPQISGMIINADSKAEPGVQEFCSNPNEYLRDNPNLQFLSYTSSLESGIDISVDHFDKIYSYLSVLDYRTQAQMLGRVRANIPVSVLVEAGRSEYSGDAFIPEKIFHDLTTKVEDSDKVLNIVKNFYEKNQDETFEDYIQTLTKLSFDSPDINSRHMRLYSKFLARNRISTANMREILTEYLIELGHNVNLGSFDKVEEIKDALKESKENRQVQKAKEFLAADITGITIEVAERIKKKFAATKEERLAAEKALILANLPEIELSEDFILEMFVKDNGERFYNTRLLWDALNPEDAVFKEIRSWDSKIKAPVICLWDVKQNGVKADLINRLGILPIVLGGSYKEDDATVQEAYKLCLQHAKEIKRLFRLTVLKSQTPIQVINKIAKKLGIELESTRKDPQTKKRIWQRKLDKIAHYQQQILEALDRKAIQDREQIAIRGILGEKDPMAETTQKPTTCYRSNKINQVVDSKVEPEMQLDLMRYQVGQQIDIPGSTLKAIVLSVTPEQIQVSIAGKPVTIALNRPQAA